MSEHPDVIVCAGVPTPHYPQPQAVCPRQEEAEGDLTNQRRALGQLLTNQRPGHYLGPVHRGDLPLVDLEDGVAAAEAAQPGGALLGHADMSNSQQITFGRSKFKFHIHLEDMNTNP